MKINTAHINIAQSFGLFLESMTISVKSKMKNITNIPVVAFAGTYENGKDKKISERFFVSKSKNEAHFPKSSTAKLKKENGESKTRSKSESREKVAGYMTDRFARYAEREILPKRKTVHGSVNAVAKIVARALSSKNFGKK